MDVVIPLKAADLMYWDAAKNSFVLDSGTVNISVGTSSADFKLTGSIALK